MERNTITRSSPNVFPRSQRTTTATSPSITSGKSPATSTSTATSRLATTNEPPISPLILVLPAVADNASTLWLGPNARILSVEDCSLPPERGPCFRRLHRWYFDALDHSCKTFIFSGCAANANNFETRDECVTACYKEEHVNVEHDRGKNILFKCLPK